MAQRNVEKPRKCDKCGKEFTTTAAGIKKHASACHKE